MKPKNVKVVKSILLQALPILYDQKKILGELNESNQLSM